MLNRQEESAAPPKPRRITNPDLNPHKAARVAMVLWNNEYAKSGLGSMGFWAKLTESQKRICREIVYQIENAPAEVGNAG